MAQRVKDEVLVQRVLQQLNKRGIRTPCHVSVSAHNGAVTLSGDIQYEVQRKTALHAAREVEGVARVVDQLHVKTAAAAWAQQDRFAAGRMPSG